VWGSRLAGDLGVRACLEHLTRRAKICAQTNCRLQLRSCGHLIPPLKRTDARAHGVAPFRIWINNRTDVVWSRQRTLSQGRPEKCRRALYDEVFSIGANGLWSTGIAAGTGGPRGLTDVIFRGSLRSLGPDAEFPNATATPTSRRNGVRGSLLVRRSGPTAGTRVHLGRSVAHTPG